MTRSVFFVIGVFGLIIFSIAGQPLVSGAVVAPGGDFFYDDSCGLGLRIPTSGYGVIIAPNYTLFVAYSQPAIIVMNLSETVSGYKVIKKWFSNGRLYVMTGPLRIFHKVKTRYGYAYVLDTASVWVWINGLGAPSFIVYKRVKNYIKFYYNIFLVYIPVENQSVEMFVISMKTTDDYPFLFIPEKFVNITNVIKGKVQKVSDGLIVKELPNGLNLPTEYLFVSFSKPIIVDVYKIGNKEPDNKYKINNRDIIEFTTGHLFYYNVTEIEVECSPVKAYEPIIILLFSILFPAICTLGLKSSDNNEQ